MPKLAVFLLLMTLASVSQALPVDSSLVGYWSFNDGTAVDTSTFGNNGSFANGALTGAGKSGLGLHLDGSNDFVSVGVLSGLPSATMTKAFWIRFDDSAKFDEFQYPMDFGGNNSWVEKLEDGFDGFSGSRIRAAGGSAAGFGDHSQEVFADTWYFIAVTTVAGGDNSIFINGVKEYVSTADTTLPGALTIGAGFGGTQYFVDGVMDEVTVWNRVLSDSEVADLMQNGVTVPTPNTVALVLLGLILMGFRCRMLAVALR